MRTLTPKSAKHGQALECARGGTRRGARHPERIATELQARFAQLTASTRQRKRFAAADAAFDDSLARASRNPVLGLVLEALRLLERHDAHARVEDYVEQRRTLMSSVITAGGESESECTRCGASRAGFRNQRHGACRRHPSSRSCALA